MIRTISNTLLAGTLVLGGCSGEASTAQKPENFTRLNAYGDQMCAVVLKTGEKVERLCNIKPAKTEVYQKIVGFGHGPYSNGGFSSNMQGYSYTQPGNHPPKSVTCTKTTPFDLKGDPLPSTEVCGN